MPFSLCVKHAGGGISRVAFRSDADRARVEALVATFETSPPADHVVELVSSGGRKFRWQDVTDMWIEEDA